MNNFAAMESRAVLSSTAFDGLGRVTQVVSTTGSVTTNYDVPGQIRVTNDTTGLSVVSAYDSHGRITSVTSSANNENRITTSFYDDAGRIVMVENAEGGRIFTVYDNAGRVAYTIDPEGSVSGIKYDSEGLIVEEKSICYPGFGSRQRFLV